GAQVETQPGEDHSDDPWMPPRWPNQTLNRKGHDDEHVRDTMEGPEAVGTSSPDADPVCEPAMGRDAGRDRGASRTQVLWRLPIPCAAEGLPGRLADGAPSWCLFPARPHGGEGVGRS